MNPMNPMNPIIFDIETEPLPAEQVAPFKPEFSAPANLKDPVKIADAIAEKQAEWQDKLALSPLTARVLCIGWLFDDVFHVIEGDEDNVIGGFWNLTENFKNEFAGHNILGFDLPFIVRRSWALGLRVPASEFARGRFGDRYVDTMKLWSCGVYGERCSLDHLAKHLGVGGKTGSGKDFAKLYRTDKPAALAYLENDCRLTAAVQARMTKGETK